MKLPVSIRILRYFNSIKVRLKPVKSKAYKPRRLYRFAGAKIQKNLQKNVDA